jgi:hypothetical protein
MVSEAARLALADHWREQLAAQPEVRAAFEAKVGAFMEWLRISRR